MANKSYIELFDDPDKAIYDPIKDIGVETLKFMRGEKEIIDVISAPKRVNTSAQQPTQAQNSEVDNIRRKYLEILLSVEKPRMDKAYQQLYDSIIKTVGEIKNVAGPTRQILDNYKKPINFTFFNLNSLTNIVIEYIKKDTSLYSENDIKTILEYMIIAFQMKDANDFPKIDLNNQKMSQLIIKTNPLDDDSIFKWTTARKNKILNVENPYHVYLFGNDYMNMWQKLCVEHVPLTKINEFDVRLKHIIDVMLRAVAYLYATNMIIFNLNESQKQKAVVVFSTIRKIHEAYKPSFGISNYFDFFFKEQLEQYNIDVPIQAKMLDFITAKYNLFMVREVHHFYEGFKEQGLLNTIKVIDT